MKMVNFELGKYECHSIREVMGSIPVGDSDIFFLSHSLIRLNNSSLTLYLYLDYFLVF